MAIRSLFPTRIYTAALPRARAAALNARLLRECLQLARDDRAGRIWSRRNYPGGFTSYASASRMHTLSPTFDALRRVLDGHVRRFAAELEFDLGEKPLNMTDCWVNVMPRGVSHGLHLHPLSAISGTYSGSVVEAGGVANAAAGVASASGTVNVSDLDPGQAVFQTPAAAALNGVYGTFTFNSSTGAWSYLLDNSRA